MPLIAKKLKAGILIGVIFVQILFLAACGITKLPEYVSEYIPISKYDDLLLVYDDVNLWRPAAYLPEGEIVKSEWSTSDKNALWDILADLVPSIKPSLRSSGAMHLTLTAKSDNQEIMVNFVGDYAYVNIGSGEEICYILRDARHLETLFDFLFPGYREAHPLD